jgi:DNA mismatch repair protein MutL
MAKIEVLPDAVADQIAAGEVVERPASVVKELVENALDAGATEVVVDLETGGRALIRVMDNGVGMERDDALLAIERHATSKIRRAADLVGVASYGFRGEALPAIASISKFELETTPGTGSEGTRVIISGGRVDGIEPAVRQQGTTVSVRRIFFNTPARRKFLRSQAAETRACVDAITLLALARLDVSFKLTSDERVLVEVPQAETVAERIGGLFGREMAEGMVPVEHQTSTLSIRGYIQRPADARPTGRKAFLFVNGRPFKDPFLVRAAETGFRGAATPGTKPSMLLSLEIPGEGVDVNVHPAKQEVRFKDRYFLEKCVEEAVRKALSPVASAPAWTPSQSAGSLGGDYEIPSSNQVDLPPSFFGSDDAEPMTQGIGTLLQVFNTFIVTETPEGLTFIDQHSAHERIIFEGAMRQLEGGEAVSQRLLIPITVDLNSNELEAVETHGEMLGSVGFEVEPFGGRTVLVHATPNPHPKFDAKACFEELATDRAREGFGSHPNRLHRFAATYGCRAAVKAGQKLSDSEMRNLLIGLFACELPPHDVHGRPTIVRLPREELEKKFGR